MHTPPHAATPIPLTQLRRGQAATLHRADLEDDDRDLLRAMGLRPDCRLRLCRAGTPCIVDVQSACGGGCRIGLARHLADRVLVTPLA